MLGNTRADLSLHTNKEFAKITFEQDVGPGVLGMLSLMLLCAVVASLGVGVAVAHGLCVAMFGIFRIHARQVAAARVPQAAARVQTAAPVS